MSTLHLLIVCGCALIGLRMVLAHLDGRGVRLAQTAREHDAHLRHVAQDAREHDAHLRHVAQDARERVSPDRVGRTVVVHAGDRTFHGTVVGDYPDRLCLEHASLVTPEGPASLPGRQDIPAARVEWIDTLEAPVEGG